MEQSNGRHFANRIYKLGSERVGGGFSCSKEGESEK